MDDPYPVRILTKRGWEIYLILEGVVTNEKFDRRYVRFLIEDLRGEIKEVKYIEIPTIRDLFRNICTKLWRKTTHK